MRTVLRKQEHTGTIEMPSETSPLAAAVSRRLYTITKFAEAHSTFITKSAVTNQIFKAQTRHCSRGEIPGNGMLEHGVIVRNGRKVLIDADAYFRGLDSKQRAGHE